MSNAVIQLRDAGVTRRNAVILDGIDLSIREGAFVGVLGPNGAGKTTLLTLINGLTRPSHGDVRVLSGRPASASGHRIRADIGYVAQVEPVDPRLPIRVRETVMAGRCGRLGWFRRPGRRDRACVDEALEAVGAAHLAHRPVGQLSGGEYQRVAIARALAQEPRIFLFDEPTASVDPGAQAEILALVERIHEARGASSLYVTHDLATLPRRCDRVLLMRDGRIWNSGSREAMLEESLLAGLYGRAAPESVR